MTLYVKNLDDVISRNMKTSMGGGKKKPQGKDVLFR